MCCRVRSAYIKLSSHYDLLFEPPYKSLIQPQIIRSHYIKSSRLLPELNSVSMAFEPRFSDLLQSTDDSTLEMDDPAPSSTYGLNLTILFGAIIILAIYAWCLICLDRKPSEDKESCTSGKRVDGTKHKADDVSGSSTSDVSKAHDQPPALSTAKSYAQGMDRDEDFLETEGGRVVW